MAPCVRARNEVEGLLVTTAEVHSSNLAQRICAALVDPFGICIYLLERDGVNRDALDRADLADVWIGDLAVNRDQRESVRRARQKSSNILRASDRMQALSSLRRADAQHFDLAVKESGVDQAALEIEAEGRVDHLEGVEVEPPCHRQVGAFHLDQHLVPR